MAILLNVRGLTKSFGARPLFEGVTFGIEEGDRVGLIGPNGAGKSTLLKIMAGITTPDSGDLSTRKGLRVSFLEQTPQLPSMVTVEEAVMGEATKNHDEDAMALGGELLSRLELTQIADRRVDTLSGGWKKRVALARELAKGPDLLLLDEPTNHLDIESILWLESFLAQANFATIIVTHDRLFLQRATSRILELDRKNPNGLLNVKGDYATYLEQKETLMNLQQREETVLRNTLRRETEWLRRGPKARTTKQQARINAAEELKQEVEELEFRNQNRTARLGFQDHEKKPKRLIEAKNISKSFGDKVLFKDFNLFIGPKDRIGLLGTNGSGKSTLIQILLGTTEADSGTILRSENLKVAYFEQNRETLDPSQTLRKSICPNGDHVHYRGKPVHILGYLDRFLFRKEQVDMAVGKLSGGEQARVLIARLMLKECNVLVLDEPTNDLDIETLDVLQNCLTDFDGAVILVTHDRYFLDQVSTEIDAFPTSEVDRGKITTFADLAQWEKWCIEKAQQKKQIAKKQTSGTAPTSNKKRKLGFNETREMEGMESKIHAAEKKLEDLEKESQLPNNTSNSKKLSEIYQAISTAQQEVERLYARWAELEAMKG